MGIFMQGRDLLSASPTAWWGTSSPFLPSFLVKTGLESVTPLSSYKINRLSNSKSLRAKVLKES